MVGNSKRLKDAVMVVSCCISFAAAFAVAMTTIAKSGAKQLLAELAILIPIVLVPPVLASICMSCITTTDSSPFVEDEENSLESTMQLELQLQQQPPWWHQFHELEDETDGSHQDEDGSDSRFGLQVSSRAVRDEVIVTKFRLADLGQEAEVEESLQQLKEAVISMGISRRRCPNVLPLLGFSVKPGTLLLASPNLPSLANILPSMSWSSRARVAALVSTGLSRLHHANEQPILQGDLTPHRIRMHHQQEDWTPYIADAGILKLTSMPIFRASSTPWSTPPDFRAPECNRDPQQQQSTKSDVYSFGVLLVVLLTGKTTEFNVVSELKLSLNRLMDGRLDGQYVKEQAETIREIARCCTRKNPNHRPDMIRVDAMLRPPLNSV